MQPLTKQREITSSGVTETTQFGISMKDQAHIKMLLRDAIYSDKELAVLREYSANAWDAHRMVGKADLPIKVTLPTYSDPVLLIEDYGPGMSHEDVFTRFTQYGDSTKRGTNDAVGMLGIGCKSGFAYSDTFTVISRFGGKKRTYVAALDEDDNDTFSLLSEEDHDPADTGVTIQIAVRKEDVQKFHTKAVGLFQYFQPRPVINTQLPAMPKIAAKLTQGLIYDKSHDYYAKKEWYAVMGCIPYRIDLEQLKGPDGNSLISQALCKASGLLHFGVGEIQINASREALKYGKPTREALVAKFEALVEEYVKTILDEAEQPGNSDWQKRLTIQRLIEFGLEKDDIGELGDFAVDFEKPEELEFEHGRSILVADDSQFVRWTPEGEKKNAKGYNFRHRKDVLVKPALKREKNAKGDPIFGLDDKPYPDDVAWAALDKLIQDSKLTGVKVVDMHEMPWEEPYVAPPKKRRSYSKEYNPKHHATVFRYLGTNTGSKASDNWEAVPRRKPQPNDVVVVISQFEVKEGGPISRNTDVKIAAYFGLTLPDIYGYKTTEKKPLEIKDLVGVSYESWRKKFLANLPADKLNELFQAYHWAKVASGFETTWVGRPETVLAGIWEDLERDHPVTRYLYNVFKARSLGAVHNVYNKLREQGLLEKLEVEADVLLKGINAAYPLLADAGLRTLWHGNRAEWKRYIRLVDSEQKTAPVTLADIAVPPEAPTEE